MHQSLHDYYWLYVIAVVILTGAVFFLIPKMFERLTRAVTAKAARRDAETQVGEATEKNKNRYKTF